MHAAASLASRPRKTPSSLWGWSKWIDERFYRKRNPMTDPDTQIHRGNLQDRSISARAASLGQQCQAVAGGFGTPVENSDLAKYCTNRQHIPIPLLWHGMNNQRTAAVRATNNSCENWREHRDKGGRRRRRKKERVCEGSTDLHDTTNYHGGCDSTDLHVTTIYQGGACIALKQKSHDVVMAACE